MTCTARTRHRRTRAAVWCAAAVSLATVIGEAQQPSAACVVTGRVTSGTAPLPGVAVLATRADTVIAATSTEPDGVYRLALRPGAYAVRIELTGFTTIAQALTVGGEPCAARTADVQMALQPRTVPAAALPGAAARGRFETLTVQSQQSAAVAEIQEPDRESIEAATRLLLPPGFSTDAPTDALAVSGNMARIDRGLMGDRFAAIGRGEIDPVTGEPAPGFGPEGAGGRGQGGRMGGPGGRAGRGEFMVGGRGRGQRTYNLQSTYTYSGSPLDSSPYQLRPGNASNDRGYNRQSFGVTVGGPVRLPGYNGGRRTTFAASYNGNRGDQLFDQYATVPTEAMRSGDFSTLPTAVIDPATGQPFDGNRIPASAMNTGATSLLRFIPLPNLDGDSRNFRHTTTTDTVSDNVNLRVTHNFTATAAGRGGRGGGGRGGGLGRGGRGNQGTSVVMNAQLQYRRNNSEQNNVFPTLGGTSSGSSLSTPVSLNVMRRGTMHNLNGTFTRSTSGSQGKYAFLEDVAGDAGIQGIADDPFAWGVPTLSFSSLTSVRDVTPSDRTDRRFSAGYTITRPWQRHTLRIGGDFRHDRADSRIDADARGAYTFTGLYSSGGSAAARGQGLDFADFLLGLPQQASVQYGPGDVRLAGRSLSLFVQDDWRRTSSLTFNLSLRYELLWPFQEAGGRMANLDVPADFTAAAAVSSGGSGPFTGAFPAALLRADANNLAPRLGVAWRAAPGLIVRGGYGVSYNAGAYASIARQMVAQPPFAVSDTQLGTLDTPLGLQDAFAASTPDEIANNYGVDKHYALGLVQTWNGDLSKDLRQVWNVGANYTHTRGSSLDIVRAPNRGPDGLRIPGVQPFLWQTSDGSSVLNALSVRARRRPVRGLGGGLSYTLAKSRDNASSIGGGGTVVAQNDQDLEAEWGLSSFDRRHQLAADLSVELPFGPNRRWLVNGGAWATLLENWRATATVTWQSGTPYTPRVQAAAADVARGTSGTLRANYTGESIQVNDPTIDVFFNTAAFNVPPADSFGSASRNTIIGPGSRQLNAQFSRDVRLGGPGCSPST